MSVKFTWTEVPANPWRDSEPIKHSDPKTQTLLNDIYEVLQSIEGSGDNRHSRCDNVCPYCSAGLDKAFWKDHKIDRENHDKIVN